MFNNNFRLINFIFIYQTKIQTHHSSSLVDQTNESLFDRNRPPPEEENLEQQENENSDQGEDTDENESNDDDQQQNDHESESEEGSENKSVDSMPANFDDYIQEQFHEIGEVPNRFSRRLVRYRTDFLGD